MPGIHLEGPCLSPSRPGVHPAEHIQPFTPAVLKQLMDPSVLLMTAAPESDEDGTAVAFLQQHGVAVSLGHSNATYEEAQRAFNEHKVRLMTHVFNALPPLHHRQPGAVTAALLNGSVTCCLIADGLHLAPAACQLVYALKGKQGTILVTDRAHIGTSTGALVGSSITLDEAVRNMTQWGITSFAEAIYMATHNPAQALGLDSIGSLAAGKLADVVLFKKEDLQVSRVILGGVEVAIEALISSRV
jgi:N-acetylglucosamine-6-phosphate deacetylase